MNALISRSSGPLLGLFSLLTVCLQPVRATAASKPAMIIETDLGGDADDQASLVRFLLYTNEIDVKAIILSRSDAEFLSDGAADNPTGATSAPEMADDYIDAYGTVLGNLRQHDPAYPSADFLKSITVHGHDDGGTAGRDMIIDVLKATGGTVWYLNWGCNDGSESSLNKALDDIRAGSVSGLSYDDVTARMPYVEVYLQNHISAHRGNLPFYMDTYFPDMDGGRWYHRFDDIVGIETWLKTYAGSDLCNAYYTTQKEGDTPTFMHLLPNGINVSGKPYWGGWSGRFGWNGTYGMWWCDRQDTWDGSTDRDNTMKRYKQAIENDFKVRAKWCDYASYASGNHHPVPSVNGDTGLDPLYLPVAPGGTVALNASASSDPDGDGLSFRWIYYGEISSGGAPAVTGASSATASVTAAAGFGAGDTAHLYLEVTDDASIALTRYKRVVLYYGDAGPDTVAPAIASVTCGSATTVSVEFTEPVTAASAEATGNYAVSDGITVTAAVLEPDSTTVALSVSELRTGVVYTLTATGITDRSDAGNAGTGSETFQYYETLEITGLTVASGAACTWTTLATGTVQFIDRTFTYTQVPAALDGAQYLQTANDDKQAAGDPFITFTVNRPATVYVLHDDRISPRPAWLDAFGDTGDDAAADGETFSVFSAEYAAGTVALGANGAASSSTSMYSVAVVPSSSPTMPVVLSSFTAQSDGNTVTLAWTTATEERNLGFNVFRSADPDDGFIKVNAALVPGAGTSVTPHTYAYDDRPAASGTWYYKLEQVDSSGNGTFSGTVSAQTNGTSGVTGSGGFMHFNRVPAGAAVFDTQGRPAAPGPVRTGIYFISNGNHLRKTFVSGN